MPAKTLFAAQRAMQIPICAKRRPRATAHMHRPHLRTTCAAPLTLPPHPSTARVGTSRPCPARHAPSSACAPPAPPAACDNAHPACALRHSPFVAAPTLPVSTPLTVPPRRCASQPPCHPPLASRVSSLAPSPPPTGANAGAPRRMRGFMRE